MKSITLLIIDESGSMGGMEDFVQETYHGIVKEMVTELDEMPDLQQFLEVWTFEGRNINQRIPFMEISKDLVPTDLRYEPMGNTPLYDAMGRSLTGMKQRMKSISSLKDAQVNVCIITDGLENSSLEYDERRIQRLVSSLKEQDWDFSYYGTNHEVDYAADSLQVNHAVSFEKGKKGFKEITHHFNGHSKLKKNMMLNAFKK